MRHFYNPWQKKSTESSIWHQMQLIFQRDVGLLDGGEVVELNYQYNEDGTKVIVTGKLLTNPVEPDSDLDGLTDEEEVYIYGTNPLKRDTDGDGLDDKKEIEIKFDPTEKGGDAVKADFLKNANIVKDKLNYLHGRRIKGILVTVKSFIVSTNKEFARVKKINFYQKKYEALETFYGWIDQGSEYDIAVEQSVYYNHGLEEIEEIILNITIATRYSRCGKIIAEQFKKRLETVISKVKTLNLQECGLTDEEIKVFNEEIEEVEALIL